MVGEQEARISLAASLCALQTLSWPSASPSSKGKQHALNEDRQGEEGSQALEPEEYSRLSYTWQDLLKAILRIDGAILPLSVFLFLLDSLALLRALSANSNNATFSNNDNNDNGSSEEHQYDSFEPDEIVRMLIYIRELYIRPLQDSSAIDSVYVGTPPAPFSIGIDTLSTLQYFPRTPVSKHSDNEAFKECASAIQNSCLEALDWLQSWLDNNVKIVMANAEDRKSSMHAAEQTEHARDLCSYPRTPNVAHTDANANDKTSTLRDMLHNTTIPAPNLLLQSTLTRAVPESRSSTPQPSSVRTAPKTSLRLPFSIGTQRWILASLLQHYLGGKYGQMKGIEGVTTYARDERDDQAIRACFPDLESEAVLIYDGLSPSSPPISVGSPVTTTQPDLTVADAEAEIAVAVAKDRYDGIKRDDKLKWLFGEPVHTQTVRRTAPLSDPKLARWNSLTHRRTGTPLIARSPVAYHHTRPRKLPFEHDSPFNVQEVVSIDRRSSWASSSPLSPPHRRAWSADSDYSSLRSLQRDFSRSDLRPPLTTNPANNDDERSLLSSSDIHSPQEWRGGAPLSRVNTNETFDSRTHLLLSTSGGLARGDSTRRKRSHTLAGTISLSTVEDQSPNSSPARLNLATGAFAGPNAPFSPRPFANLYPAKPSTDALPSESNELMPPTTNVLSSEEKQHRIRKNRKLRAMLGSELDDEKLDAIARSSVDLLNAAASAGKAVKSVPVYGVQVQQEEELRSELLDTVVKLTFDDEEHNTDDQSASSRSIDMSRSSSGATGSEHSSNDSFTSPDMSGRKPLALFEQGHVPDSPKAGSIASDGGSPTSPVTIMRRPSLSPEEAAREARRRKLKKVQAFLGERVPATALSTEVSKGSGSTSGLTSRKSMTIISKASNGLHRRLTKAKRSTGLEAGAMSDDGRHPSRQSHDVQTALMASVGRSRSWNPSLSSVFPREEAPNVDWDYVQVDARHLLGDSPLDQQSSITLDVAKSAEPIILAVRRARKLEKVFGSLPPAQLYDRPKKKVTARNDRSVPDNASLRSRTSRSSMYRERIASLKFIAESDDAQLLNDFAKVVLSEEVETSESELVLPTSEPSRQEAFDRENNISKYEVERGGEHVSRNTSETRPSSFETQLDAALNRGQGSEETGTTPSRPSVSSCNDPVRGRFDLFGTSPASTQSLQEHLRHPRTKRNVLRRGTESILSAETMHSSIGSAYALDEYGDPQRSVSRASYTTSLEAGTPRSSMESVRIQFRRAHKLAHVFGTTRGEIFNRVLDDIEADIAEADEEELDEEDRLEIKESVAALRQAL